jgi:hypothetical protein
MELGKARVATERPRRQTFQISQRLSEGLAQRSFPIRLVHGSPPGWGGAVSPRTLGAVGYVQHPQNHVVSIVMADQVGRSSNEKRGVTRDRRSHGARLKPY